MRKSLIKLFLLCFCLMSSTGCATYKMMEAPPRVAQKTTIKFSEKAASGMNDIPIGVYRVPDSRVIISGNFKGGITGLLFGLTGVFVQSKINTSLAHKTVEDVESQLRWDLNENLTEISKEILKGNVRFSQLTLEDGDNNNEFVISSYLLLDSVQDVGVIPYIFLKVIKFEKGKKVWSSRYIASAGEARSMVGKDGWIGNDDQRLENGVRIAMTKALTVLYEDMINPYLRKKEKDALIKLRAQYPYFNGLAKLPGWVIMEDEHQVVFIPKVGDALVFSGVNIYKKEDVEILK